MYTKDKSVRTRAIKVPYYATIASIIMIIVSVLCYVMGFSHYKSLMARSSTPVGSDIIFTKSQANLKLAGLYTDQKKDVLIARFTVNDGSNTLLPYKGTDYTVVLASPSLNGHKSIPTLFGKMSTDGDMFLIIPKPTKSVYNVMLINRKYDELKKVNEASQATSTSKIQEQLSQENSSLSSSLSKIASIQVSDDRDKSQQMANVSDAFPYDIALMRLTIDPAIDSPLYQPIIIDGDLINEKTHEFNFKEIFNQIYKNSTIKKLKEQYADLQKQKASDEELIKSYKERIINNPKDAESREAITLIQSRLTSTTNSQLKIASQVNKLESLKYDPSLFNYFNDKAAVMQSAKK